MRMRIPILSQADLFELADETLNYFDEGGRFVIAPNTAEHRARKEASGELLIYQDEEGNIVIAKDTPENRAAKRRWQQRLERQQKRPGEVVDQAPGH